MKNFVTVFLMLSALIMPGMSLPHAAATISPVERIIVYKSKNIMQLLKGDEVVRSYQVALGRNADGPKQQAGDCRTPEGAYTIDSRKVHSKFHKALHISYPNRRDLAVARNHGHAPGGYIMIHGLPKGFEDLSDIHFKRNWTKGCIAVNNAEMDEIWRLVANGTPITIKP